ncbi:MAG: enoyl-CoA hydratase/isomerase family protein [Promethearchaeota archaeon]
MEDIVLYEKTGDIGIITLNKPEERNTITLDVLKKLIELFEMSAENEDVCVIYAANGKHFTVGADLKYSYDLITNENKFAEGVQFLEAWQTLTRKMIAHPGIIIVGYHGWVIGGGFEHTLACDIRIAATDTRIMLPEAGVGLFFSNASTKLLPRIIGEGRAKDMMIFGDEITAEEALKIGLVTRICKPESVKRILKKTANTITQKGHLALRYTKAYINENQDIDIEGVLARESVAMIETSQSDILKERLSKFVKHEK